jgi:hypothetical protein
MWQVHVTNNEDDGPACRLANWQQSSGTLVFKVCQDVPPQSSYFNMSVVLRNPATTQAAPTALASMATSATSRLVNQPVNGSVLQAKGEAHFRDVRATEVTSVVSQLNPVSISFAANVPLSKGTNLTIHNLLGFKANVTECAAATTTPLTVSLPSVDVLFKEEAGAPWVQRSVDWRLTVQRMKDSQGRDYCGHVSSALTVTLPRAYAQWSSINVTVHLTNEDYARPGGKPSISVSGCRAGILLSGHHFCPYKVYTPRAFGSSEGCSAEQQLTPPELQPIVPGEAPCLPLIPLTAFFSVFLDT